MHHGNQESFDAALAGPAGHPIGLLLVIRRRLHREGYAALVKQDGRFEQVVIGRGGDGGAAGGLPVAALVDAECDEQSVRDALVSRPVVGGVLLVPFPGGPGSEPLPGPVTIGGVALTALGQDATWDEVAAALTMASAGRAAAVPADRRDWGESDESLQGQSQPDQDRGGENQRGQTLSDDVQRYLSLTRREREVLTGLGAGLTPPEIAADLHIAVSTAENHKSRLMKKINIHRTAQLVRFAIRVGAAPL